MHSDIPRSYTVHLSKRCTQLLGRTHHHYLARGLHIQWVHTYARTYTGLRATRANAASAAPRRRYFHSTNYVRSTRQCTATGIPSGAPAPLTTSWLDVTRLCVGGQGCATRRRWAALPPLPFNMHRGLRLTETIFLCYQRGPNLPLDPSGSPVLLVTRLPGTYLQW